MHQSLGVIKSQLLSDKVRSRASASSELAEYLEIASNTDSLTDKDYYQLLETLSTVIKKEKNASGIGSKVPDAASQRLHISGDLVKTVVERGLGKFKAKTINFILWRIISDQFFVSAKSGSYGSILDDPLLTPMAKICFAITSYPSHVEHLANEDWKRLASICSEVLYTVANHSRARSIKRPLSATNDFMESLYYLLKNKTTSDLTHFPDIYFDLFKYLQYFNSESSGHIYLFKCLNEILVRLLIRDIKFCQRIATSVFEYIPHLLSCKIPELKTEILIFLMHSCKPLMMFVSEDHLRSEDRQSIQQVYKSLLLERSQSPSTYAVSTTQMRFLSRQSHPKNTWGSLPFMCPGSLKLEYPWLSFIVSYKLAIICSNFEAYGDYLAKKIKVDQLGASKYTDPSHSGNLLEFTTTHLENFFDDPATVLNHVQILTIYFQDYDYYNSYLTNSTTNLPSLHLTRKLLDICYSSNLEIASWAMIAIGLLIRFLPNRILDNDISYRGFSQEVWKICCQRIYNKEITSAACFSMSLLIDSYSFSLNDRLLEIKTMIGLFDSHGPAISSGSLQLWDKILSIGLPSSIASLPLSKGLIWLTSCWVSSLHSSYFKTSFHEMVFSSLDISKTLLNFCGIEISFQNLVPDFTGRISEASLYESTYECAWEYLSSGKEHSNFLPSANEHDNPSKVEVNKFSISSTKKILNECERILTELREMIMSKSDLELHLSYALGYILPCIISSAAFSKTTETVRSKSDSLLTFASAISKEIFRSIEDDCISEELVSAAINGSDTLLQAQEVFSRAPSNQTKNFYIASSAFKGLLEKLKNNGSIGTATSSTEQLEIWGNSSSPCSKNSLRMLPHDEISMKTSELDRIILSSVIFTHNSHPDRKRFSHIFKNLEGVELICSLHWFLKTFQEECSSEGLREIIRICGVKLLQNYNWQTSELALTTLLQLLIVEFDQWATCSGGEDLRRDCVDILNFIFRLCSMKKCFSEKIKKHIGLVICRVLSDGGEDIHFMRDWQEDLLPLIRDDSFYVRFVTADNLTTLHSGLYRDGKLYLSVYSQLGPIYPRYEELALRGYIIASMAISGNELPVPIYNLLEISLAVKGGGSRVVSTLMAKIASHFLFKTSKELFRHVASPILFYWIHHGILIGDFPFFACGYETLSYFLRENVEEISAQAIVEYGDEAQAQLMYIANIFKGSVASMIEQSFEKAIAYSTPSFGTCFELEQFFTETLEMGNFSSLLSERVVSIVAELIQLADFDTVPEEFISKGVFSEIYSDMALKPLPQYIGRTIKTMEIPETIERLCDSVSLSQEQLWSPSTYVYVIRKILSGNETAVQEVGNCRKLRRSLLVMEMSNGVYSEGYPLELTVMGLIPFITSELIGKEATRVLKLLFEKGLFYFRFHKSEFIDFLFRIVLCYYDKPSSLSNNKDAIEFLNWILDFINQNQILCSDTEAPIIEKSCHYLLTQKGHLSFLNENIEDVLQKKSNHFNSSSREAFLTILSSQLSKCESNLSLLNLNTTGNFELADIIFCCATPQSSEEFKTWLSRLLARSTLYNGCRGSDLFRQGKKETETDERLFNVKSKRQEPADSPFFGILNLVTEYVTQKDFWEMESVEDFLRSISYSLSSERNVIYHDLIPREVSEASLLNETPKSSIVDIPTSLKKIEQTWIPFDEWIYNISLILLANLPETFPTGIWVLVENLKDFRKSAFPFLLHEVIQNSNGTARLLKDLENHVNFFLGKECDVLIQKSLIEGLLYLNFHNLLLPNSEEPVFKVDLTKASRAADNIKMHKSALYLYELYWSQQKDMSENESEENSKEGSLLLSSIYKRIQDPDIIYSAKVPASLQVVTENAIRQNMNWQAVSFEAAVLDDNLRTGSNGHTIKLGKSFLNIGLNGMAKMITEFAEDSAGPSNNLAYSWKLQQWDLPVNTATEEKNGVVFNLFKQLNDSKYGSGSRKAIFKEAYRNIFDLMKENSKKVNLDEMKETLGMVYEIEEIMNIYQPGNGPYVLGEQRKRSFQWSRNKRFNDYEDIMAARLTAWNMARKNGGNKFLESDFIVGEALSLLDYSRMARENHEQHKAIDGVVRLENLSKTDELDQILKRKLKIASQIESSSAAWDMGDQSASIEMLKTLVEGEWEYSLFGLEPNEFFAVSEVYSTLALRSSQARQESGEAIHQKYLAPAEDIVTRSDDESRCRAKVYHAYAVFCDRQYTESTIHEEIESTSKLISRNRKEIQELEKLTRTGSRQERHSVQRHLEKAKLALKNDEEEYNKWMEERNFFLRECTKYYLKCITESPEYSGNVSRFCALWLANSTNNKLNKDLRGLLKSVPSVRLAPWLNQLSSRLSTDQREEFHKALWTIIPKICTHHPYHSLYQIVSLKRLADSSDNENNGNGPNTTLLARADAGKKLWHLLHRYIDEALLRNFDSMCGHMIKLAEYKVEKSVQRFKLENLAEGEKHWWMSLDKLRLPPPTKQFPLRDNLEYENIARMMKVENKISLASGLSRPKVISVTADDGQRYKMLVKAGDDLRQDAIMEQVFDQLNEVFKKDERTRTRCLNVRTYKVIPLGHRAGIIEFVQNTIPLYAYLQPKHDNYYPNDFTVKQCREEMSNAIYKSVNERVKVFEKIMNNTHPVLRHFFLDYFHSPDDWLRCRTSYSRSTATVSILGHILGLGDRHCNNILLDSSTGEVVHIDFGYAFDQGKTLKIPETVPFRLTRDLVDGMGIGGMEGVFRRCCEFTLSVLRNEMETILTVLNVLRYDPLYKWTISPLKRRKQKEASTADIPEAERGRRSVTVELKDNNEDDAESEAAEADRALTIVRKKLSPALSTEAVTRELINQATHSRNLALLFSGWCPFL